MARTVFFDLDGTLTDPMIGITESIRYALERLGLDAPEARDLTWCIGPPLLENFRKLVGDEAAPSAVLHYRERFGRIGLYENEPYPGIHEALSALRDAGAKLCVASSKPQVYVEQILAHFELSSFFSDVFGSELDGRRTDKSELLRFALSETRVAAEDATMIGDRKHDIVGALDNRMAPIAVLYGYGSEDELAEAGATRFARTPTEVAEMLLQATEPGIERIRIP